MDRVQLKQGKYSLRREGDNRGDSGPVLLSHGKDGTKGEFGEIIVGCSLECGSITARTFEQQDYWLTTPVTEILEVNEEKTRARVRTRNSIYVVESF